MRIYCWQCPTCDTRYELPSSNELGTVSCANNHEKVACRRDYRAESVGIGPAVGNIRRGIAVAEKSDARASLFLPTAQDFVKQYRGNRKVAAQKLNEWNERHEPQDPSGNKYRPKAEDI